MTHALLLREVGAPAEPPCLGCWAGDFALTRLRLTALSWRVRQGRPHAGNETGDTSSNSHS